MHCDMDCGIIQKVIIHTFFSETTTGISVCDIFVTFLNRILFLLNADRLASHKSPRDYHNNEVPHPLIHMYLH